MSDTGPDSGPNVVPNAGPNVGPDRADRNVTWHDHQLDRRTRWELLGATGAVRTATLMHGMRRHKKKYGMVTMCIGTGMGAAGLFESL